jgi:hypothetical protein
MIVVIALQTMINGCIGVCHNAEQDPDNSQCPRHWEGEGGSLRCDNAKECTNRTRASNSLLRFEEVVYPAR